MLKSVSFITGTAVDHSGKGLKKVEITLKNINTSKYWTGTSWSSTETWLTASHYTVGQTYYWKYNVSTMVWSSASYVIRSKATDNNLNVETPGSGTFFTIDNTAPKSTIQIPTNNLWLKALKYINGTSSDSSSPSRVISSGIARIEISIYREVNKRYWDGSDWVEAETWLTAVGTYVWYYDCSDVKWHTHNKYIIRSRAIDNVGNYEIPGSGSQFIYDNVPPKGLSISIENGRKLKNIPFVKVKLSFEETLTLPLFQNNARSILEEQTYKMSFSFDGITWTPWEDFVEETIIELTSGDGEKTVYFRVMDPAGNIAEGVSDTIILDTTPPMGLDISINDDAEYTNSRNIILNLNAFDALAGLNNVSYSFDGKSWSDWETFNSELEIIIPDSKGDGVITVYFKVSDLAGNIAEPVSDTITLDTQTPMLLNIQIDNGAEMTNSTTVTLTLFAVDQLSGVYMMRFSEDGLIWTEWEEFSYDRVFELSSGDGIKTIYYTVIDEADNVAKEIMGSIILMTELDILDTDGDGYSDDNDAFLNNADEWKDTDTDGVGDNSDAFPDDPAASIDSDSDGYPDSWNPGKSEKDSSLGLKLDDYPFDPTLYKKDAEQDESDWTVIVIIIVIAIIIFIIVIFSIVLKSSHQRKDDSKFNDKMIRDLMFDILNDKIPDSAHLTDEEILTRLNDIYKNGEISSEAYLEIKNSIE
jgi:hypothetical protein